MILLTWLDAGVVSQGDWMDKETVMQAAAPEKFLNHTCGWLLHEDKACVIVAAQVAAGEPPEYDLVMRIPKALVQKRVILKSPTTV